MRHSSVKAERPIMGDDGVADVVGSVLMVGLTVLMMAGVGALIASMDGPEEKTHHEISVSASPGTNGWGTGDEAIVIRHDGGEPLPTDDAEISYDKNGIKTTLPSYALDGVWTDGSLSIGETWRHTLTIAGADTVTVFVKETGSRSVLAASGVVHDGGGGLDCSGDTTPPTVASWVQAPLDVVSSTTGSVSVTVTVSDDCSGPDPNVVPHLHFRIGANNWTDLGDMTLTTGTRWHGSIPDQGWSGLVGSNLTYKVTGFADRLGNVGNSGERTDVIDAAAEKSYVDSFAVTWGNITNFAWMQAADDSQWADLDQHPGNVISMYAQSVTSVDSVASATDALGVPDDTWMALANDGHKGVVGDFDTTGQTAGIDRVEIVMQSNYVIPPDNDYLRVFWEIADGNGARVGASNYVPPARGSAPDPLDEELLIDITSDHAGWTWTELATMEVRVEYQKSGGGDSVIYYVDSIELRVTEGVTADQMDIQFDVPDLPSNTVGTLEIRYRASADSYDVLVWDGTNWNSRGSTLAETTWTYWQYSLTSLEKEPGAGLGPKIRIVDQTPGTTPGSLDVDYIRVTNR